MARMSAAAAASSAARALCRRRSARSASSTRRFPRAPSSAPLLARAMMGMRPVVEIMWAGLHAGGDGPDRQPDDQPSLYHQRQVQRAAGRAACSKARRRAPAPAFAISRGAAVPHSGPAHRPSLDRQDAYDMLRAAIADDDPTIIIESRAFYQRKEVARLEGPVERSADCAYAGRARIWPWSVGAPHAGHRKPAQELAKLGIDAAVIDLRWLSPLPEEELIAAVRDAGGAALVVHEANPDRRRRRRACLPAA